jgi:hypothetical protein
MRCSLTPRAVRPIREVQAREHAVEQVRRRAA